MRGRHGALAGMNTTSRPGDEMACRVILIVKGFVVIKMMAEDEACQSGNMSIIILFHVRAYRFADSPPQGFGRLQQRFRYPFHTRLTAALNSGSVLVPSAASPPVR